MFSGNKTACMLGITLMLTSRHYSPDPQLTKVSLTKKKEKPPKHKPKAFHQSSEAKEAKDAMVSKFMDRQYDRSIEKIRAQRRK